MTATRRIEMCSVFFLLMGSSGCKQDTVADQIPSSHPSVVRQQVETPVPQTTAPTPGLDREGRLLPASDLVAGFEVPMRAKFVRMRKQYLELELKASPESVVEFYTGADRTTGRRFVEREYTVAPVRQTGDINVRHTKQSLRRLGLASKYDTAHIAIRKLNHWNWQFRVYDARNPQQRKSFVPELGSTSAETAPAPLRPSTAGTSRAAASSSPAGASAGAEAQIKTSGRPGAKTGGAQAVRRSASSSPSDTSAAPETETEDSPAKDFAKAWDSASVRAAQAVRNVENPSSTIGGIPVLPGQKTIQDHQPGRYGPYPATGRKSIREKVRRWQAAHPNQQFLD